MSTSRGAELWGRIKEMPAEPLDERDEDIMNEIFRWNISNLTKSLETKPAEKEWSLHTATRLVSELFENKIVFYDALLPVGRREKIGMRLAKVLSTSIPRTVVNDEEIGAFLEGFIAVRNRENRHWPIHLGVKVLPLVAPITTEMLRSIETATLSNSSGDRLKLILFLAHMDKMNNDLKKEGLWFVRPVPAIIKAVKGALDEDRFSIEVVKEYFRILVSPSIVSLMGHLEKRPKLYPANKCGDLVRAAAKVFLHDAKSVIRNDRLVDLLFQECYDIMLVNDGKPHIGYVRISKVISNYGLLPSLVDHHQWLQYKVPTVKIEIHHVQQGKLAMCAGKAFGLLLKEVMTDTMSCLGESGVQSTEKIERAKLVQGMKEAQKKHWLLEDISFNNRDIWAFFCSAVDVFATKEEKLEVHHACICCIMPYEWIKD